MDFTSNLILQDDNYHTLKLMVNQHIPKFDAIYLDPPYNVGNKKSFTYKNDYHDWIDFMKKRLLLAKRLLKNIGVLIISIGYKELIPLGSLLHNIFKSDEIDLITVINNPRGQQGRNFSTTNEFMYFIIPNHQKLIAPRVLNKDEISKQNLMNHGSHSLRSDGRTTFYPIIYHLKNKSITFGNLTNKNIHPHQNEIHGNNIYIYPIDKHGVEHKWRYSNKHISKIKKYLLVQKMNKGNYEVFLKKKYGKYRTVWISNKYDSNAYGKQHLRKLVPNAKFSYPKSIYTVFDALNAVRNVRYNKKSRILDFFNGSGTTAEAVQMLNKRDNGHRTFVNVEKNNYAKTIQIPRIETYLTRDKFHYYNLLKN